MANEPIWIDPAGVVRINARLVRLTGEPHRLVRPDLLGSACDKPRNHWAYGERDAGVLASELLSGLARNHPFVQGNKRTAFTAMVVWLTFNNYRVAFADDVAIADLIIDVLQGHREQDEFTSLLRRAIFTA